MKNSPLSALAAILTMIAASCLGAVLIVHLLPVKVEQLPSPPDLLSHPQRAWLGALEWCESKGKPTAINPKDRDNTPSYGILQFKPSTLTYFAQKYGITGDLMDPDTQEHIVEQMIVQGGIDWHHQFPVCSGILGKPPISKI